MADIRRWKSIETKRIFYTNRYAGKIRSAIWQSIGRIMLAIKESQFVSDMLEIAEKVPVDPEPIERILKDLYLRVGVSFSKDAMDSMGLKLDIETIARDTYFLEAMRNYNMTVGSEKVVMISETNRLILRGIITEGIEKGWGVPEMTRQINLQFVGEMGTKRARMIARTEVMSASSKGTQEAGNYAINKMGIQLKKSWIPTPFGKYRPAHLAMGGRPPIEFKAFFIVNGFRMEHPHDFNAPAGEVINCRCAMRLIPA